MHRLMDNRDNIRFNIAMSIVGPASRHFISQRLRLHYVDWGNEDAPTLVLLHGGMDHCRSWDWTANALKKDWHVVAPDLRGHGDSNWSPDGDYKLISYLYDFAQFIYQLGDEKVTIVGHSLGGNISTRFTGLYPEKVEKLVSIEGLGLSPQALAEREETPRAEHIRKWIDARRAVSARSPRRFKTLEEAYARMHERNKFLSDEQARHLSEHGAARNEDGSWSWKFDDYVRTWTPIDIPQADIEALWAAITCPTLLVYGDDSWASNPEQDGRAKHFQNAAVISFKEAGHWVHHDQFDKFLQMLKGFLAQ